MGDNRKVIQPSPSYKALETRIPRQQEEEKTTHALSASSNYWN
ncbi:hypothetical protein NC653_014069 [Populus alba x Populus x berolinensis]|uniref:Uncharacterized protein n=1 Tax=Populus alba x Populus x berolinensis TaxID=444605 RepID=A0AAD6QW88_9ROSI|nr:hypothetical protein NC653_014069 [Populus alba x Populus x berolinensis]